MIRFIATVLLVLFLAACPGPPPALVVPINPCTPPGDTATNCPTGPLDGTFDGDIGATWFPDTTCDSGEGARIDDEVIASGGPVLRVTDARCVVGSRLVDIASVGVDPQPTCPLRPYRINMSVLREENTCDGVSCAHFVVRWYAADMVLLYEQYDVVGPPQSGVWWNGKVEGYVSKAARFYSLRLGGAYGGGEDSPVVFDDVAVTLPYTWEPVVVGGVNGCQ